MNKKIFNSIAILGGIGSAIKHTLFDKEKPAEIFDLSEIKIPKRFITFSNKTEPSVKPVRVLPSYKAPAIVPKGCKVDHGAIGIRKDGYMLQMKYELVYGSLASYSKKLHKMALELRGYIESHSLKELVAAGRLQIIETPVVVKYDWQRAPYTAPVPHEEIQELGMRIYAAHTDMISYCYYFAVDKLPDELPHYITKSDWDFTK